MKAFILANISKEGNKNKNFVEYKILEKIRKLKEVEEAYLLFGEWDLIIKIKGIKNPQELANFVINKIRSIKEIKLTSTMIVAE